MPSYETLEFNVAEHIARITLNRVNDANGINPAMARELADVAATCDASSDIRVVILSANGKFFSAGGDVKAMAAAEHPDRFLKSLADDLHRALATFARMSAPIIVAVNGMAAGAGFSLTLAGDLTVAAESARFTMAYTKVGLSPDGGSSYFLPRLVGLRKAQELMLTNRMLSAEEALDWGLVNRVVPDEDLLATTEELAATIMQGAPRSNAIAKQLLLQSFGNGPETQMELEGREIAACAASASGQEGIAAFTEKRKPNFSTA